MGSAQHQGAEAPSFLVLGCRGRSRDPQGMFLGWVDRKSQTSNLEFPADYRILYFLE
jgi:hypothetical protein